MSTTKQVIHTDKAPPPIPVLSQGVIVNGIVYCSGQVAVNPATGKMVEGTVGDRTEQILKNLAAVLEAGGSSMAKAVKVNVFLTNMGDFAAMNEVYGRHFPDPKPGEGHTFNFANLPKEAADQVIRQVFEADKYGHVANFPINS